MSDFILKEKRATCSQADSFPVGIENSTYYSGIFHLEVSPSKIMGYGVILSEDKLMNCGKTISNISIIENFKIYSVDGMKHKSKQFETSDQIKICGYHIYQYRICSL